jgi:hypothetical protein
MKILQEKIDEFSGNKMILTEEGWIMDYEYDLLREEKTIDSNYEYRKNEWGISEPKTPFWRETKQENIDHILKELENVTFSKKN